MIMVLMLLLTAFHFSHFGGATVPKTGAYSKTTFNCQLVRALFFVIVIINQKRNYEKINL